MQSYTDTQTYQHYRGWIDEKTRNKVSSTYYYSLHRVMLCSAFGDLKTKQAEMNAPTLIVEHYV
jgi:hypothetical protein